MSLSLQECISRVKEAYPDHIPYAYVEYNGSYVFTLIEKGHGSDRIISDFHAISPEDGIVSGSIPTLFLLNKPDFVEKWKNAIVIKKNSNDISHSLLDKKSSYRVKFNNDYLFHHGIKGQHWGEQNGPPYPLDEKTHNKVVNSDPNRVKKNKGDGTTGGTDPELIASLVGVGAWIASMIGLSIWSKKFRRKKQDQFSEQTVEASKDLIGDIADVGKVFSKDNPPKMIKGKHTPEEDMAAVNPKYFDGTIPGTSTNCTLCAFTYDMRRRGYDVTANATGGKGNYPDVLMKDIYIGASEKKVGAYTFARVYDKIAKTYPEGSRGEFSAYGYLCGHSMVFEVTNGKTIIRCPQTNQVMTGSELYKWGFDPQNCCTIRTDNLEVRMENLHKVCSELKPGWKKLVSDSRKKDSVKATDSKVKAVKEAAGRKVMTEAEKKKSLELQWKKDHKGQKMDSEAKEAMNNWINGHMWSAPWQYGQNSLMHYGVKGQKWGQRNYQNLDGTLTAAGKIRYGTDKADKAGNAIKKIGKVLTDLKEKSTKKETGSVSRPDGTKWKSKDAKDLSDAELNSRNSRLQREEQYKNLTTPQWKKTSKEIRNDAIKKIAAALTVGIALAVIKTKQKEIINYINSKTNRKIASIQAARILESNVKNTNILDRVFDMTYQVEKFRG